jgi:hypothetical protein
MMHRFLLKLFELYIKASLHVALAVTALALVTVYELGISADPFLLIFIFSSTVVSYNFTKYVYIFAAGADRSGAFLKRVGVVSALAFTVMCLMLFRLPLDVILLAAVFGAITIAYAIPISEGRRNLRSIYGIKIAVIALVWAGVTVGLPVINHGPESVSVATLVMELFQRFLFVVVLILPFDIRDYRNDDSTLGTLPQLIGVRESKVLGMVLLISCVILEGIINPVGSASFVIFGLMAAVTAVMVRRSMMIQSRYFASFWVEGIPVFWAILLILSNTI